MSEIVGRLPRLWPVVLALTAMGLVGIVALVPINAAEIAALADAPDDPWRLSLLAAAQPLGLLVAGAVIGTLAAPRVGFRSLVADRLNGFPRAAFAFDRTPAILAASLALGFATVLLDEAARPLWLPDGTGYPAYPDSWSPATLLFGVTYGGLTEEVMMRWGLMSALVLLLASAIPHRPRSWKLIVAGGIVLSALVFAAGHVPAMASILPLAPGPIVRTLVFNSVIGIWLGWVFWRRHLEMAMMAHASIHAGFALYVLTALALR